MATSDRGWYWQLAGASLLGMGGVIADLGNCALTQIIPDATLGSESSVVTPNAGGVDVISGGATRGANLFHSFEQFSVPTGSTAYFNNGADIQNIISQVMGGSVSNIDGLIRANGNANLFLLNPNGIIFGPNASLNIGGSFLASTASSLNFANGTQFGATAPQTTQLLTVSVPIGLQFGGTVGSIVNQSQASDSSGELVGLQVQPGKTLALVGGNVVLEGGRLTAAGGRIELGSVAGTGLVSLNPADKGWALGYEGIQNFQDIQLSQQALVDASGEGGGDIQVQGRRVTLTGGVSIAADTLGSQNAGGISMGAEQLIIRDGAVVSAFTFGSGQGGMLEVTDSDSVELVGTDAKGFPSSLSTSTFGTGSAGKLRIQAGKLTVRDGARVSAETFDEGQGGMLEVTASESVNLINTSAIGLPSTLSTGTFGAAVAGNLRIQTGQLTVRDGAQVQTSTSPGSSGQGGMLEVTASESVNLIGTSSIELPGGLPPSSLVTATRGTGAAGDLRIQTGQLTVRDGAQVSASAVGNGQGGNLVVTASDTVELVGTATDGRFPSALLADSEGTGVAGNLTITTGQLTVRDGAEVAVSSGGSAKAGEIQVQAGSIRLDNRGVINGTTRAGNGGDITLQAQDLLLMRRNSNISTRSGTEQTGGTGGSITIGTDNLVALENSDIDANAFGGAGGQVRITAQGIFGTKGRKQLTLDSDITASSNLGPQFSGTVEINTPDVDLSSGLATLPAELVDVSGLIAQGCPGSRGNVGRGVSEFIITGRGGLPPQPGEALRTSAVMVNGGTLEARLENREAGVTSKAPTHSTPVQLVEAQGWVINNKGEVVLTATAPTVIPNNPWINPATCHARQNPS